LEGITHLSSVMLKVRQYTITNNVNTM